MPGAPSTALSNFLGQIQQLSARSLEQTQVMPVVGGGTDDGGTADGGAAEKKRSLFPWRRGAPKAPTAPAASADAAAPTTPAKSLAALVLYAGRAVRADPAGSLRAQLGALWSCGATLWAQSDIEALPWYWDSIDRAVTSLQQRPLRLELRLTELSLCCALRHTVEGWFAFVRRKAEENYVKLARERQAAAKLSLEAKGAAAKGDVSSAAAAHAGAQAVETDALPEVLPLEAILEGIDQEASERAAAVAMLGQAIDSAQARVALHVLGGDAGKTVSVASRSTRPSELSQPPLAPSLGHPPARQPPCTPPPSLCANAAVCTLTNPFATPYSPPCAGVCRR